MATTMGQALARVLTVAEVRELAAATIRKPTAAHLTAAEADERLQALRRHKGSCTATRSTSFRAFERDWASYMLREEAGQ